MFKGLSDSYFLGLNILTLWDILRLSLRKDKSISSLGFGIGLAYI